MNSLTYERLLERLEDLFDSVPKDFPGPEDAQRVKDVLRALKAGMVAARAGLNGDQSVLSPGQLKHWVNGKVADMHDSHDREAAVSPSTSLVEAVTGTLSAPHQHHVSTSTIEPEDVRISIEDPQIPASRSRRTKEKAASTMQHPATRSATAKKVSTVIKRPIKGSVASTGMKKNTIKRKCRPMNHIPSPPPTVNRTPSKRVLEAAGALLGLFKSSPSSNQPTETVSLNSSSSTLGASFTSNTTVDMNGASHMNPCNTSSPLPTANLRAHHVYHQPPTHIHATNAGFLSLSPATFRRSASPEHIFLAGVQFAMQNFETAHMPMCCSIDDDFAVRCYENVRSQLGLGEEEDEVPEKNVGCEKKDAMASKGFWDVI